MRLYIPEVLEAVSNATTHQEKVWILRENASDVLEQVLQYNYHPEISFSLPEGAAPFKREDELPLGKSHTNLFKEGRRLYIFLKGYAPNLKAYKKEQLFIELLEGVHPLEADVLNLVKDKQLETLYPGLTYESSRDAFAQLLPAEAPKRVAKEKVKAVAIPLGLPVEQVVTTIDVIPTPPIVKPKKVPTEAQLAGLKKAQEARKANAAAKRLAKLDAEESQV